MDKESTSITRILQKQSIGDQIRSIADRLKQETNLQIKVTSKILGAAAQIAENHDQLIDEVVDMVEQDLDQKAPANQSKAYTVKTLKQQFGTLSNAKAHFDLKASSWAALVSKLTDDNAPVKKIDEQSHNSIPQRIEGIEQELKVMQADIKQILALITELLLLVRQHPLGKK